MTNKIFKENMRLGLENAYDFAYAYEFAHLKIHKPEKMSYIFKFFRHDKGLLYWKI